MVNGAGRCDYEVGLGLWARANPGARKGVGNCKLLLIALVTNVFIGLALLVVVSETST